MYQKLWLSILYITCAWLVDVQIVGWINEWMHLNSLGVLNHYNSINRQASDALFQVPVAIIKPHVESFWASSSCFLVFCSVSLIPSLHNILSILFSAVPLLIAASVGKKPNSTFSSVWLSARLVSALLSGLFSISLDIQCSYPHTVTQP